MDLISLTFGLPFAPVRGLVAIAQLIQEEAEQQLYSPTAVRQELEELETAQAHGELSDEETEQAEQEVVNRVLGR
jgi:Gas vesicle protein G